MPITANVMQLIGYNTDTDDDTSATTLAASLGGDGKANLACAAFQVHALNGVLKQSGKQLLKIGLKRFVAFLQSLVGGAEILGDSYFHNALSASTV